MTASPGVPPKSAEDAQREIERDAERIVGALGGGPLRRKTGRVEASKTDSPVPPPTSPATAGLPNAGPTATTPTAPTQPQVAQPQVARPNSTSAQSSNPSAPAQMSDDAAPQDPCAISCDALTGMLRAVDRLCDLVGQSDDRCTSARDRASDALDRVTRECPVCPT